jgi:hypothetical protein
MKDNKCNYTISGYSNEVKAVSGLSFIVNGIFESFKNFTIRMQEGQSVVRHTLNRKHDVPDLIHQEPFKQMPLEQLIRMGFYHF